MSKLGASSLGISRPGLDQQEEMLRRTLPPQVPTPQEIDSGETASGPNAVVEPTEYQKMMAERKAAYLKSLEQPVVEPQQEAPAAGPSFSERVMAARGTQPEVTPTEEEDPYALFGTVNDAPTVANSNTNPLDVSHTPEGWNPTPQPFVQHTGMTDAFGNPLSQDQIDALYREQLGEEAADARKLSLKGEINDQFPKSFKGTAKEQVTSTANDIGHALVDQPVSSFDENSVTLSNTNGIDYLKQALNTDERGAIKTATMSSLMATPMLVGAAKSLNTKDNLYDLSDEDMEAARSLIEDAPDVRAVEGGVPIDAMAHILGGFADTFSVPERTNGKGQALNRDSMGRSPVDKRAVGYSILDAGEKAGLWDVAQDKDGNKIVRLNPFGGRQLYDSSQSMRDDIVNASSGKASLVPAIQGYQGGRANIRSGDKKKPGYKALEETQMAKDIAGSVAKVIDNASAYIMAIFSGQAINTLTKGQPSLLGDTTKLLKINAETDPDVIKNKIKEDQRIRLTSAERLDNSNMPMYDRFWEDYQTHRMYNDSRINAQRNKGFRSVVRGVSVPLFVNNTAQYHQTGISLATAKQFWQDMSTKSRNKDFTLTEQQREISFLLTAAHALDAPKLLSGVSASNFRPQDILQMMTPQFMQKAGSIGEALKSLVPTDDKAIIGHILNPSQMDVSKLDPRQQAALKILLREGDRENIGFKIKAYIDMANYLAAKKGGRFFTPTVTTAIDMNSAGRSFLANDIGDHITLKRVGLIWEHYTDDLIRNMQPNGSPRDFFTEVALAEVLDTVFGTDGKDKADTFKQLMNKFMASDSGFSKSFAKAVLLQTDYGKSIYYHLDNARKFLNDNPSFKAELLKFYNGDEKTAIKDINSVYGATLKRATSVWQQDLPKNMVMLMQMANHHFSPEGFWNEPMSLGSYISRELQSFSRIGNPEGNHYKVAKTAREMSMLAAARDKNLKDEEGNRVPAPGEGTLAINQVGPLLGQYRESVMEILTINYINEGKKPSEIKFFEPVFDNFILNADSFPFFYHVANNIIAPQVLKWNLQKPFIAEFKAGLDKSIKKVEAAGEADIGESGDYKGILVTLDREYKYMQDPKEGKLSPWKAEFKKMLDSKGSGYQPPSADRPKHIKITPEQFKKLIYGFAFYKGVLHPKTGGDMAKWDALGNTEKLKYEKEIDKIARENATGFMT